MAIEIPARPALVDTNVLVGYFDPRDQHSANAVDAIEGADLGWIVLQAVLVEAWGLLRKRAPHAAFQMVAEISTQSRFFYLDSEPFDLPACRLIVETHRVDVADAILATVAKQLLEQFRPMPVPIYTTDVADFSRIVKHGTIYDISNREELVFR